MAESNGLGEKLDIKFDILYKFHATEISFLKKSGRLCFMNSARGYCLASICNIQVKKITPQYTYAYKNIKNLRLPDIIMESCLAFNDLPGLF